MEVAKWRIRPTRRSSGCGTRGSCCDKAAQAVGPYARDVRDDRLGEVMGRVGGRIQLGPLGGGPDWDVPPQCLDDAAPAEVLRERVRLLNREVWRRVQLG
ncbi:hypothetical protein ACPCI1_18415 [Streptomyces seoulensis]|uniref:hypothetical protein n=1 Tax=Streptomyces seoulensis TaxID=73044 RepID=UPI003C2EBF7D